MLDAAQTIIEATGCSQDQARSAVEALMDAGWLSPRGQPNGPLSDPQDLPETSISIGPGAVITAHTDGACSGNPGPGGWAVVFSIEGSVIEEFSGNESHTTNNQMELTAIREALLRAPPGVTLEIATDSRNAIGWLSEGWKRNKPTIAALCAEIDRLCQQRVSGAGEPGKVTFRYVRGHCDDPLNERADRLATAVIVKGPLAPKRFP